MLAGRYEIVRQLGGGGFAITYLARDNMQPSKPLCVVKQLYPHQSHALVIKFFEKEAAILERLGKHPQIPQLLAHFSENQNFYLVQEFISGQDLSKEIQFGKRLSESYVTNLLEQTLSVLSFVHQQGVIHRDIKPPNLMRRNSDGKIFLIDFGAVKEVSTLMVNTQGEVMSTVVIGTAGYMPNEQKNGKPTLASDVYALGMTAIQALTGVLPYNLEEDPQTGEVIWQNFAQVSNHLGSVLTKMVRRHHTLRYSSAEEALVALIPPPPPPPPSAPPPPPAPPPNSNLTRRRLIQTSGLVGVGFAAAVVSQRIFLWLSENRKFEFNVLTVNSQGIITNRRNGSAEFFTEDLGDGITLEMVKIPDGSFTMGSPEGEEGRDSNEGPQRTVTVQPFFMGRFAITQEQYQQVMGNNPSRFKGEKRPVENVSWNDATNFCDILSKRIGKSYRLPSEAEWEYACRALTTTPFHFGETITTELVNYDGRSTYAGAPKGQYREQTVEVGTLPPNAFGLYEMHGNVWEWCQDNWHENYQGAPDNGNPWLNENDNRRLLRGGSWFYGPRDCRSAVRGRFSPDYRDVDRGFRVVVSG
jgi:formylglycine-generating enzyme required for sulfatase activity